ncbi:MAG: LEA type 2 family protein [bacterium]
MNAVLISFLALFGLLVLVVVYTGNGGPAAESRSVPSTSTTSQEMPSAFRVAAVQARWDTTDPAARHIVVTLVLQSNGTMPGRATAVTYEAFSHGRSIAAAKVPTGVDLAPAQQTSLWFVVPLGANFVPAWWDAYVAADESSDLSIKGLVEVADGGAGQSPPFSISNAWTGNLADTVAAAAHNCADGHAEVCLDAATASWRNGSLDVNLRLRNPGADVVVVRGIDAALDLAGNAVASGTSDTTLRIPAGGTASAHATLGFSRDAMAAWWPGHVGRCETSPVVLELIVQETPDNATAPVPPPVHWTFQAHDFATHLVCQEGA